MSKRRPGIVIKAGESPKVDLNIDVSLEALQRAVGGSIECITLSDDVKLFLEQKYGVDLGKRPCLTCNDDAIALQLIPNISASIIYTLLCGERAMIFGDCVVVDVP